MLVYGSYLGEKESLWLGAAVTLVDTGIAFIAGLLIIPAIYVARQYGADIFTGAGDLIAGPDLIFQVLPLLFDSMGAVGLWVAFAFFLLMSIASLTSSISMLEVPVSLAVEQATVSRVRATLMIGAVVFICSAVILLNFDQLFSVVISFTTVYSQPLLGMLICLFVGWIWHRNNLLQAIQKGHADIEKTWFWENMAGLC